eukprot:4187323-Prymnesium_polylepis.1
MAFEDDERRWFPNLTGEMDEWPSDSEMDEDTLEDMHDAHMEGHTTPEFLAKLPLTKCAMCMI